MADQSADNQSQPQRQRDINAGIITLALHDLAAVWPMIDWGHPDAAQAVKQLYGAVIQRYGQSAASVASLLYDEIRESADVSRGFVAAPADPIDQAHIDRIVDSAFLGSTQTLGAQPKPTSTAPEQPAAAAQPEQEPATGDTMASIADHTHDEDITTSDLPLEQRVPMRLEGSATRLIQQPGRDTIVESAANDPAKPRWIRVPTSANPCAFCIVMASRSEARVLGRTIDQTYTSSQSAGIDGSGVFNKYHNHCMCVAVPVFSNQGLDEVSPKIADYQDMYHKAAAEAGTHRDFKAILAAMRQLYGVS